MKYYIFYRADNKFTDILADQPLKKKVTGVVAWHNHLMIGVTDDDDHIASYINLKYSEDLVVDLFKDFAPVPGIDYIQTKKPK